LPRALGKQDEVCTKKIGTRGGGTRGLGDEKLIHIIEHLGFPFGLVGPWGPLPFVGYVLLGESVGLSARGVFWGQELVAVENLTTTFR